MDLFESAMVQHKQYSESLILLTSMSIMEAPSDRSDSGSSGPMSIQLSSRDIVEKAPKPNFPNNMYVMFAGTAISGGHFSFNFTSN